MLFDPKLAYPSDHHGRYMTLEGVVMRVHEGAPVFLDVKTSEGVITGEWQGSMEAKEGYLARIQVYDAGGGSYPDNQVVHLSAV